MPVCPYNAYLVFSVISWYSSSSRDVIGCVEKSSLDLSKSRYHSPAFRTLSSNLSYSDVQASREGWDRVT